MSAIIEATRAEIERTEKERDAKVAEIQDLYGEQLERLREIEEKAVALNGAAPAESEGGGLAERAKAPASPPAAKPDRKPSGGDLDQRAAKVLAAVKRKGPRASKSDIVGEVGLPDHQVKAALSALREAGKIVSTGVRAGTRYSVRGTEGSARPSPAPAPAPKPSSKAKSNGSGPQTEQERAVAEAVADIGLTASEIASNTELPESRVKEVAGALVRRGVLTSYGSGERPVFQTAVDED